MLHIKDSNKLFEFKDYFKSPTKAFSNIVDIFGVFSLSSITRDVFGFKSKGYSPILLLQMLILSPFLGATNIHNLFDTYYQLFYKGKKDSLYDILRNNKINWRGLLFNFAKQFIKKSKQKWDRTEATFFIADDSDLEKRTPFFEGIGKVFNHVIQKHVFAYKLLALGYSDGKSFIPLDFSLHNEKGKNKNYGLTKKQRKQQYKKKRNNETHGAKRKTEIRIQKGKNLIKMVKRAVKHGIIADYLLTDSWFMSEDMINNIRKIKNGAIHIISMCRMDKRKYTYEDNSYNGKELLRYMKQDKGNIKRSRKHKLKYIAVDVDYKGFKVKLFFIRLSKRSKWRLLTTTNTSLSFIKAFEFYANRWAIEVFFKESKQLLGLGKNQSRDFDAQIASTTISFIQYIILATHKRANEYETLGGIFRGTKENIAEQVFSDRVIILISDIISFLVDLLDLSMDVEKLISRIIEKTDLQLKISLVFSTPDYKGGIKNTA